MAEEGRVDYIRSDLRIETAPLPSSEDPIMTTQTMICPPPRTSWQLPAYAARASAMQRPHWQSAGLVLTVAVMLAQLHATASVIDLGIADSFAVLAGGGITIANASTVTGDIGSFPTPTMTGLEKLTLIGVNYAGDATTQNAKNALVSAYNTAAGLTPNTTYGAIYDLGGHTLAPGVYNDPSSFAVTGVLTLDGGSNPNAVWVFQAGSTLGTASGSQINLINGAQAGNVYWQVGSSATLGTDSSFAGSILALTDITLTTGATVDGRLLARNGAVTLDYNTVATPVPEPGMLPLLGIGLATVFAFRRRVLPLV